MKLLRELLETAQTHNFKRDELTSEAAEDLLLKHCAISITNMKAGKLIFRGEDRGEAHERFQFSLGDSTKFVRRSANTKSWTNQFVDSNRLWRDYPPRLSSYICSTNFSTANDYGEMFVVVPFDDAKVGICPENDFWPSFKTHLRNFIGSRTVLQLNDAIRGVIGEFGTGDQSRKVSTDSLTTAELEEIFKKCTLEALNEMDEYGNLHGYTRKVFEYMSSHDHKNFYDALEEVLDPAKNNFSYGLKSVPTGDREVWVHGKCVFIKWSTFQTIKNKLGIS